MNDPIVEEVRCVRDTLAARFHYDLELIVKDIQLQEAASGLKFMDYSNLTPTQRLALHSVCESVQNR